MSKLKLRLEDLRIDSFTTEPAREEKGTVFGEQCTCYTNCSCPGCPTCDASCNGTCNATACGSCGASCGGTCDATACGTCGGYTCGHTCGYTCYDGCGYTALQTNCNEICY